MLLDRWSEHRVLTEELGESRFDLTWFVDGPCCMVVWVCVGAVRRIVFAYAPELVMNLGARTNSALLL